MQVADLPPGEGAAVGGETRESALDRLCAGDAALRAQVLGLLAAADRAERGGATDGKGSGADGFMAAPTGELLAGPASTTESRGAANAPLVEGPGTRIGPYKLLEAIGEGGFGSVFLAEQTEPIRRRVALKIIKVGMDTRQVVARFEAERQALALMDHPHIARVLDGGETSSGRPYFVMQYVVGDAITAFANAHKLDLRARLALFCQVCSAVQHAHTKGIIHRDIKPGNILVSMTDGKPFARVIDFGIAKATAAIGGGAGGLTDKTLFTQHRQLIGTPEYMSPEQAEGSPDLDTRTDVYALGVLLYELLTGVTPFDGKRLRSAAFAEMQRIIKEEEPPAPSVCVQRRPASGPTTAWISQLKAHHSGPRPSAGSADDLRGELDWIVMKALDKDRARRYETPNSLAADVERHLSGAPVLAAPPGLAYRAQKFMRRHRARVVAAGAVAAALVIGLVGTAWQAYEAAAQRDAAELARQNEATQRAKAEEQAKAARAAEAKQAEVAAASRGSMRQFVDQMVESPELRADERVLLEAGVVRRHLRDEEPSPEQLRKAGLALSAAIALATGRLKETAAEAKAALETVEANAYVANIQMAQACLEMRLFGRARERLEACPEKLRGWEWRWLDASADTSLAVMRGHTERIVDAAFSPDGSRLVTASLDHSARVWDTATGRSVAELKGHTRPMTSAAFSPDGTRIVTASHDMTARVWDAVTGAMQLELKGHAHFVAAAAFSPDGSRIVSASWDKTVRLWNASDGSQIDQLTGHAAPVISAMFNADGTRIASASLDGTARVWDATAGTSLLELTGHSEQLRSALFSPDGSRIVTASADKTARVWNSSTGALVANLTGHAEDVVDAEFTPDGERVLTASADGTARLWDARTGACITRFEGHTDALESAALSADGTRVVTASYDMTARVWDAETGKTLTELRGHTAGVDLAAIDRSSHRVVTASRDKTARVWDASRRDGPSRVDIPPDDTVVSATFMVGDGAGRGDESGRAAGARTVAVSIGPTAKVWDAASGNVLSGLSGDGRQVRAAGFSPDGRRTIGVLDNNTVRVWNTLTGATLSSIDPKNGIRLGSMLPAISPDGARIVVLASAASKRAVVAPIPDDFVSRVWDATTGKKLLELKGHTAQTSGAAFSPDGSRIATASMDKTARVWDTEAGTSLVELKGHTEIVWCAAFSPDGSRVLTGSHDKTARLWDAGTGACLAELKGHEGHVVCVAFSPDGTRIVTGAADGIARLWAPTTGGAWANLIEFKGHPRAVLSAVFSPDGEKVVTASGDGTVRTWDSVPHRTRLREGTGSHSP